MNPPTDTTRRGNVAVVVMDNPPVNGLGHALREAIIAAIDAANDDPAVRAVVLTGSAKSFSGGADVREFGTPKSGQAPTLLAVLAAVEDSAKPVVAAIAGNCLGGGLELAMACHYRVAAADASIGLPEVKLGLLPGATGTQRLPRLVGIETAMNMIVSGAPAPAARLKGTALFDAVVDGGDHAALIDAACTLAEQVAERLGGKPAPKVRDLELDPAGADAFIGFARNSVAAASKNFPAPLKCVEAVAAAYRMPWAQGIQFERELFLGLMQTPESRALRHVFAAERAASKIADAPADTALRPIERVGVIGAGTMGGGIAMAMANAGLSVTLLETKQEALDRGLATIRKNYEGTVKKGRLKAEAMADRLSRITPSLDYEALADADLVIEAVFEDMGVKEAVFSRLDAVCKPGAILASNTSYLDVDRIASFTKRPGDVLGLHFFSPANVMRLLEIVRGAKTTPDVLASCMALAKRIKKIAVVSGVCDGFIGNRMLARYGAAAARLIDQGASPQQVDRALQNYGMAMGPFRVGDLAGLDIGWATRKRRAAESGQPMPPMVADRLCEAGRFGQKTGAGWYRYEAGKRDPIVDPAVEQMITEHRAALGITPRRISDDEIVERCIYALVNEGARILEEGIAARASDIDLVYLNGYGFPLHRGGPMLYADTVGLPNVVRSLRRFAADPGAEAWWQPAPLLLRLAAEGRGFNS